MRVLAAVLAVLSAFIVSAAAQGATPAAESLSWMAGCWEHSARGGAAVISEQWMKPAGGTLIGMSRTVSGGKTVAWEFIRIVTDADGLSYVAKPNMNKDETVFKLARSTPAELVFENLAHDFPQRIIYRNGGADSLFARIEGTKNGNLSGMDIPMKRVKCGP